MTNYVLRNKQQNHVDIGLVCAPNINKGLSRIINTFGWACVKTLKIGEKKKLFTLTLKFMHLNNNLQTPILMICNC